MLGNVPHDWLFKHVSCVVHHGGAGTTAAGITAGRPTVVVPFFGDQPFWGAMVARAGAGPDPIPHKQLTVDKLVNAINFCLKHESLERAQELASKIAADRGSDMGAQSFHQFLEPNRLRCTLAPSRPAAWRVKRTKVRLSAFAACTLVNAKLLDFNDLKLFRPQKHCIDEGPWDPISGSFTAFIGAVGGMMMGLADVPSETWRALQFPAGRRQQKSESSVPTIARESESSDKSSLSISPGQSETSLIIEDSLGHPSLSDRSTPTSNFGSSSMPGPLQEQLNPKQDDANQSRCLSQNKSGSSKDSDMLRPTGVHMSKGAGRFVKAVVQGPVDISVNITRGFHNIPKLWGDDTVRPQERVSDLKSGVKAVGREFAFGWYDGFTGLVTQPWKGAQREGASGLVKGVGKGIGGFIVKPGTALFGILGHTMQGVSKEAQKLFGSNVQDHIIASRVGQGYEEWLQSSDAEKQDVIVRWKLIRKDSKTMGNPDETVREAQEAQKQIKRENREDCQDGGYTAMSAQSANSVDARVQELESATLAIGVSQSPLHTTNTVPRNPLEAAEIMSHEDAEVIAGVERKIMEDVSQLQRQRQDCQARSASEAEAHRHTSDGEWDSDLVLDDEDDDELERERKESEKMSDKVIAVACGSLGRQRLPSYDAGHLEGTTRGEFEAQQNGQQREKTTQEMTEEEIVMEYIRKQSLLEVHHQTKRKGRAMAIEDQEDEDLQKVLRLSMQEHGARYGEASGI